ncbi:hypothetical protein GCM10027456_50900 [Kineosporia babensis]
MSHRLEAAGPIETSLVWRRYCEPALWPLWSPQVRRVEYAFERIRPGTPGRVFGPGGLWLAFWIEDVRADERSWTWLARRGPWAVALEHAVQPTTEGTRTQLAIRGPAPLVLPYLPLARYALHRLVNLP